MESLWPWLVLAGLGGLHGLNPATGWALAAAWGLRSRSRAHALRALLPLASGHAASMALAALAVVWGLPLDRTVLQVLAGILFAGAVATHLRGRVPSAARVPAGHAGLALWSFMASTAHGSGVMLVPALVPLCSAGTAGGPAAAPGPLLLALAGVAVHAAAMLAVTGAVAAGACGLTARCGSPR